MLFLSTIKETKKLTINPAWYAACCYIYGYRGFYVPSCTQDVSTGLTTLCPPLGWPATKLWGLPYWSSVGDGQKCSNINQRESKRPSAHSECFCFFPRPLVEITTVQITDGFPFSRQRGVYIVHQRVLPGLADEAAC